MMMLSPWMCRSLTHGREIVPMICVNTTQRCCKPSLLRNGSNFQARLRVHGSTDTSPLEPAPSARATFHPSFSAASREVALTIIEITVCFATHAVITSRAAAKTAVSSTVTCPPGGMGPPGGGRSSSLAGRLISTTTRNGAAACGMSSGNNVLSLMGGR